MTPARFPTAGRRVGVLLLSLWLVLPLARAVPAFPGAEGFGANATGGRGGEVYVVTNLNDSGPGSFRDAVSQPNRYVVFAVGGIIPVSSRIVVASNLTIAGQTAPGEGITLYGNGLSFSNANNTVTRYLRIRMGVGGDSGKDAVTIAEGHDMMFDHVSVSWGRDETFSISGDVRNVTIQDSIIAQGLQTHSAGGLIQTDGGVSILRTLYIANHTRNPKVKGVNDFVNNVVYNWGGGGGYILGDSAGPSYANIVNNLFIDGPQTTVPPFSRGNLNFHVYVANNVHDGNRNGILDGTVVPPSGYTTVDFQTERYPYPSVSYLLSPEESLEHVATHAGASLARDRVDRHLIDSLLSLGTDGEIISNENDAPMFGPGPVAGGIPLPDRDQDGMPDAWELALGLDPDTPDHNGDLDGDGYTNLEDYLNALASAAVSRASVDRVAPDTGASETDAITSENRLVLHGRATPGSSVTIRRVGIGQIGTATAGPDGTWSLDYTGTPLPTGLHAFSAVVTEPDGWTSPPTRALLVSVDTTAPSAPAITSVSRADTLQIRGSAEPGAQVVVTLEGTVEPFGIATTDTMGLWTVAYDGSELPAGIHTFIAQASDLAGNEGAASTSYVVDTRLVPPTIDAISEDTGAAADDFRTRDATLVLQGTAEADATVAITHEGVGFLGTAQANGSGAWTFDHTGTPLAPGEHWFTATASIDGATSFASPARRVQIDTETPRVTSIRRHDPTSSATVAGDVVFRVSFSEDVLGADVEDFALSTAGTTAAIGTVTAVNASIYDVAVNGLAGEGTVRLDLRASGTGIVDRAGNAIATGFTSGESYTVRLPGSGVWIASDSGAWSEAANWEEGAVASGVGATADFSTVEIEEELVVQLDGARTIGHLAFGDLDPETPANVRLIGTTPLSLDVANGSPSITVNPLASGATATVDVPLSSTSGLAKQGTGAAVLTQPNAIEGSLAIGRGALRLAPGAALEATTVAIGNGGTQLQVAGGEFRASELVTITSGGRSGIDVSAGVARFDGGIVSTNSRDALVRVAGGQLFASRIEFPRTNDGSINFGVGLVVQGGEARVGTIALGTANSWGTMSIEGGALHVDGPVFVGWQVTSGRGGRMRVTGGSFTVTDTEQGLVLARNPGTQPNNVASAEFTGGVSVLGRVTLGYDATSSAGSATFTLNGGAVYIGSGGIVAHGTGGFAANVNLTRGVLGAAESWQSDVPMALPADNDVVVRAANSDGEPRDITLAGALTGLGGLRKTGGGTLVLAGDNTFTGTLTVDAGTLRASGERPAGGALVLAGDAGLAFELGAAGQSDRLAIPGGFLRGSAGQVLVHLTPGEGFAIGETYTLATFDHTTFTAADFVATGLPAGSAAMFAVNDGRLTVTIVGAPVFPGELSAQGTVGEPFDYTLNATGAPSQYAAVGLPEGLTLETTSGRIHGTPLAAGSFAVDVSATNAAGTGTAVLSLTIEKATASLTLAGLRQSYDGTPHPVTVTTTPADLEVTVTYAGNESAPWLPGEYNVVATINDPDFQGSANATLEILPTAIVRYGFTLNSDVVGSVQLVEPGDVVLNSGATITGDLLVPGSPDIRVNGGTFAGVRDGDGAAAPSHHRVILNGNSVLRHVVRRVDAGAWPSVESPRPPTGHRNVVVNRPGQDIGDPSSLRNLTLNATTGEVAVPPGAYGTFIVNGSSVLVLGSVDADEPVRYDLQQLLINSSASLRLAGPVVLHLAQGITLNGSVGDAATPGSLRLELAQGGVTLNGGSALHAEVRAPNGTITLNGTAILTGRIQAARLQLNGTAVLQDPNL